MSAATRTPISPHRWSSRSAAPRRGCSAPRRSSIGRDTRESGPRIEADLTQGLAAEGASVRSLGVASTPAIAFLAQRGGVPAAIVSASHNPWTDNGVKLVGPDGRKLARD